MALSTFKGTGDIKEIVDYLIKGVQDSGFSNELVHSITRESGNEKTYLLVFEKWYYRTGSRASLTVLVTESYDTVIVDAIGAGGGQGFIFKFTWGAEENFVGVVRDLLIAKGFRG